MILKIGSKGLSVIQVQEHLGLTPDGYFGKETDAAVRVWQQKHELYADGVVGADTWTSMGIATTDISEITNHNEKIADIISFLPKGEYIAGPYKKKWLFMHHTAGWQNPLDTAGDWANDNRGAVATEFVIGGQSILGDDIKHDGILVKCMPDGAMGWHLGIGNNQMHRESVGVELCNFGRLTKGGYHKYLNGKWVWIALSPNDCYTYVGGKVCPEQVVTLYQSFRGCHYWHRYSDKQLIRAKKLIQDVGKRDEIDMRKGIPAFIRDRGVHAAFDYCDVDYVSKHPGLWTHANVSKTKTDMFPQQELVDMFLSI